ncbi:hypothetical protein BTI69_06170 [Lactobacillus delbrueckii subsp. bulgaricus]|nr:hypothetical protein [Lactobacillus delbrueckii subsp. bulgaricus]
MARGIQEFEQEGKKQVHHDDEKDEPVGCIGMVDKIEEEQIPDKGQNACVQVDKIPPGEKGHRNKQVGWQDFD